MADSDGDWIRARQKITQNCKVCSHAAVRERVAAIVRRRDEMVAAGEIVGLPDAAIHARLGEEFGDSYPIADVKTIQRHLRRCL